MGGGAEGKGLKPSRRRRAHLFARRATQREKRRARASRQTTKAHAALQSHKETTHINQLALEALFDHLRSPQTVSPGVELVSRLPARG